MGLIQDRVIAISRIQKDTDNANKEQYVPNEALSCVAVNIQPASATDTAIAQGVFGQTYVMFTTESGILSGDKVTVSGTGDQYIVRGIEDWSFPDLAPHYEVTLVEMEEDQIA